MAKPKSKTRPKARTKAKAKPRAKAARPELPHLTLSSLRRPPGSHRARIRKGRGPGSVRMKSSVTTAPGACS